MTEPREDAAAKLDELAERALLLAVDEDPLWAALIGIEEADGRVPDASEEDERRRRDAWLELAGAAEAVSAEGLSTTDAVTRSILVHEGRGNAALLCRGLQALDVTAFLTAPQARLLSTAARIPVATPEAAEEHLQRLEGLPGWLDAVGERQVRGSAADRPATARGARDAIAQLDRYLELAPEDNPLLAAPAPEGWTAADVWAQRRAALVAGPLADAVRRYRQRVETDVLPRGRDDEHCGLSWLDGGAELYRDLVRVHTTTERTPEEVHATGLDVIAGLAEEYREIGGRALGEHDLSAIFTRLRTDPGLRFDQGEEARADAEAVVARAVEGAPTAFHRLPQTACEVRAIPEVEASGAVAAYYQPPNPGAGTGGTYWINTTGPVVARYESECIAFHEAIPGHHLQIGLQQELEGLPRFRRLVVGATAYVEGWGLYTERLADELGWYSGDLARLGMLACDSLRAGRLVVDAGLHHLGWSRQRAIDFLLANSAMTEDFVVAEVDRYIVYPGQACAYMIGRLELNRLREVARAARGAAFDLRDFHAVVLDQGALPLALLEQQVLAWPRRVTTRVAGGVLAAVALAACQPVDQPVVAPSQDAAPSDADLLGNPDEEFPTDLAELRAFGLQRAVLWQDDPRLSVVVVYLDGEGDGGGDGGGGGGGQAWERVRLTYVAPDADRILTVEAVPDGGARVERQTLSGLQLQPITAAGVAELPDLPDDALEPAALAAAAAPALEQCDAAGDVAAVIYANGAPESWDGQAWASAPVWRTTVLTPDGGAVVRPDDATPFAPLTCPDPLLPGIGENA